VTSPVQLTTRIEPNSLAPETVSTLIASVQNLSEVPVDGRVSVTPPRDWPAVAPSAEVTVAPGETREVQLSLSTPLTLDEGASRARTAFGRDGVVLASSDASVSTRIPVPEDAADHIDLGDQASESAHNLTASAGSGQNT